jgi:hypothetical protein
VYVCMCVCVYVCMCVSTCVVVYESESALYRRFRSPSVHPPICFCISQKLHISHTSTNTKHCLSIQLPIHMPIYAHRFALSIAGFQVTDKDFSEMFQAVDADKAHSVDFYEFMLFMVALRHDISIEGFDEYLKTALTDSQKTLLAILKRTKVLETDDNRSALRPRKRVSMFAQDILAAAEMAVRLADDLANTLMESGSDPYRDQDDSIPLEDVLEPLPPTPVAVLVSSMSNKLSGKFSGKFSGSVLFTGSGKNFYRAFADGDDRECENDRTLLDTIPETELQDKPAPEQEATSLRDKPSLRVQSTGLFRSHRIAAVGDMSPGIIQFGADGDSTSVDSPKTHTEKNMEKYVDDEKGELQQREELPQQHPFSMAPRGHSRDADPSTDRSISGRSQNAEEYLLQAADDDGAKEPSTDDVAPDGTDPTGTPEVGQHPSTLNESSTTMDTTSSTDPVADPGLTSEALGHVRDLNQSQQNTNTRYRLPPLNKG